MFGIYWVYINFVANVTDLINEAVTDPVGKLVVGFAMNALSDAIKKDVMDENNEEVNNVNTLENV